jgi:hypothetical protein
MTQKDLIEMLNEEFYPYIFSANVIYDPALFSPKMELIINNERLKIENYKIGVMSQDFAMDLGLYGVDVRKEIKSMVKNMLTQKNVFLFENYQGFILTDFGDEKIVF